MMTFQPLLQHTLAVLCLLQSSVFWVFQLLDGDPTPSNPHQLTIHTQCASALVTAVKVMNSVRLPGIHFGGTFPIGSAFVEALLVGYTS